ncbi:hypothetical protein GCM10010300_83310 [Streptomyces olivaceoviridis]|nr:hypothetical protein GCM10010300_83310 [Streptomyces olivaceoviridis]
MVRPGSMVTAAADTFVDTRYRGVSERPGHAQARVPIAWHLIAQPERLGSYQELDAD